MVEKERKMSASCQNCWVIDSGGKEGGTEAKVFGLVLSLMEGEQGLHRKGMLSGKSAFEATF